MKKIDKAKLFDFFASKHSNFFYVFPRSTDPSAFGLNIIVDISGVNCEFCLYDTSTYLSSFSPTDFNCKHSLNLNFNPKTPRYIKFTLKSMPKKLKEAVIDKCIENNSEIFFSIEKKIKFIPAAKSLEELAIKMELES